MICPNCGYKSEKRNLTVKLDVNLINKAKEKGINVSQTVAEALYEKVKQ